MSVLTHKMGYKLLVSQMEEKKKNHNFYSENNFILGSKRAMPTY